MVEFYLLVFSRSRKSNSRIGTTVNTVKLRGCPLLLFDFSGETQLNYHLLTYPVKLHSFVVLSETYNMCVCFEHIFNEYTMQKQRVHQVMF